MQSMTNNDGTISYGLVTKPDGERVVRCTLSRPGEPDRFQHGHTCDEARRALYEVLEREAEQDVILDNYCAV